MYAINRDWYTNDDLMISAEIEFDMKRHSLEYVIKSMLMDEEREISIDGDYTDCKLVKLVVNYSVDVSYEKKDGKFICTFNANLHYEPKK